MEEIRDEQKDNFDQQIAPSVELNEEITDDPGTESTSHSDSDWEASTTYVVPSILQRPGRKYMEMLPQGNLDQKMHNKFKQMLATEGISPKDIETTIARVKRFLTFRNQEIENFPDDDGNNVPVMLFHFCLY